MAQAVINQSLYTGDSRMPFMQHLKELRDRLMRSSIAIIITTATALIFGNKIIELLQRPTPEGTVFIQTELLGNMSVWFNVGLTSGVVMAMPFLVYQLFAYVAPGLTSKEKRMIFTLLPGITLMFLAGVAFAYFVALPPAMGFLFTFNADVATPMIKLDNYIGIVTRMLLVIGLVFETPIIVMLLAKLGLVSPQWLAQRRRLWMVVAFVVAAIITPTFDPINQCIIAIPLILLNELGILLSRLVYKKKREVPVQ